VIPGNDLINGTLRSVKALAAALRASKSSPFLIVPIHPLKTNL
jgi:hypothetical protein